MSRWTIPEEACLLAHLNDCRAKNLTNIIEILPGLVTTATGRPARSPSAVNSKLAALNKKYNPNKRNSSAPLLAQGSACLNLSADLAGAVDAASRVIEQNSNGPLAAQGNQGDPLAIQVDNNFPLDAGDDHINSHDMGAIYASQNTATQNAADAAVEQQLAHSEVEGQAGPRQSVAGRKRSRATDDVDVDEENRQIQASPRKKRHVESPAHGQSPTLPKSPSRSKSPICRKSSTRGESPIHRKSSSSMRRQAASKRLEHQAQQVAGNQVHSPAGAAAGPFNATSGANSSIGSAENLAVANKSDVDMQILPLGLPVPTVEELVAHIAGLQQELSIARQIISGQAQELLQLREIVNGDEQATPGTVGASAAVLALDAADPSTPDTDRSIMAPTPTTESTGAFLRSSPPPSVQESPLPPYQLPQLSEKQSPMQRSPVRQPPTQSPMGKKLRASFSPAKQTPARPPYTPTRGPHPLRQVVRPSSSPYQRSPSERGEMNPYTPFSHEILKAWTEDPYYIPLVGTPARYYGYLEVVGKPWPFPQASPSPAVGHSIDDGIVDDSLFNGSVYGTSPPGSTAASPTRQPHMSLMRPA